MSDKEYETLRAEILSRIQTMNNQAFNSITFVVTTWVAGFSLLSMQLGYLEVFSDASCLLLSFGQMFSFFFSICLMYPLAIKSGENLKQITMISAYIRVFFEFVPEEQSFMWERAVNLVSASTSEKGLKNSILSYLNGAGRLGFHNGEYAILGAASLIFVISAFVHCLFITDTYMQLSPLVYQMVIVLGMILIIIGFETVINIYRASSVKSNMMKVNKDITFAFLNLALTQGLIDEQKAEQGRLLLNPNNSLDEYRLIKIRIAKSEQNSTT